MGNSGSKYTPPPPTPMPIEDSVGARNEAAQLISQRMSAASRTANDLNGDDDNEAITRGQIAKAEAFSAQPQPRGPAGNRRHHQSAATRMSTMGGSGILTG